MNATATYEGYMIFLIVGLGDTNEYSKSRHSVGYQVLDDYAYRYQTSFTLQEKFHCEMTKGIVGNHKVVFMKPSTVMEECGKPVALVKTYYNISLDQIYIMHDDIALDLGIVKVKTGGSHNGHPGIKSIDEAIGTDYHRVRIGVGKPPRGEREQFLTFLRSGFNETEQRLINETVVAITDHLDYMLQKKWMQFRAEILKPAARAMISTPRAF